MAVDVRANVEFAIDRILAAKLPRLASLTGFDRRVLLVSRNYLFAEPQMLKEILETRNVTREQVDTVLFATEDKVHWVADPGRLFN